MLLRFAATLLSALRSSAVDRKVARRIVLDPRRFRFDRLKQRSDEIRRTLSVGQLIKANQGGDVVFAIGCESAMEEDRTSVRPRADARK